MKSDTMDATRAYMRGEISAEEYDRRLAASIHRYQQALYAIAVAEQRRRDRERRRAVVKRVWQWTCAHQAIVFACLFSIAQTVLLWQVWHVPFLLVLGLSLAEGYALEGVQHLVKRMRNRRGKGRVHGDN